jgi:ADP-ribose pyrophosphatase YjhB (NUDIX family)
MFVLVYVILFFVSVDEIQKWYWYISAGVIYFCMGFITLQAARPSERLLSSIPPIFCSSCGSLLESKKKRKFCRICQRVRYQQLIVGVGALIVDENKRLLLIRRASDPFKQMWNLPGGHVEADESPERALSREVCEETGLQVDVIKESGRIYFFDDHPDGKGIMIVYDCRRTGGTLVETTEGFTPTFFAPDQLPNDLAGGGHKKAVGEWKQTFNNEFR